MAKKRELSRGWLIGAAVVAVVVVVYFGWARSYLGARLATNSQTPEYRLAALCAAVKQAGVLAGAYDSYCRTTYTPTPTPTTTTSLWQNPKNKYDVNNDGFVTPQDALVLVNTYNSKGVRDLVKTNEPAPPPYIDVNGDTYFTALDWQLTGDCVNKGGQNCL